MSSAGWFPQPDGRERYYNGEEWTNDFRAAQSPVGPPPAPPQKKESAWKWILIVLFIVLVVCCGGFAACSAGVVGVSNEVSKSIESESGGVNKAVTVAEGEAFEVRGFDYAEGWTVTEEFGLMDIEGLKVTNNRDMRDSALVDIKLMKGTEVLASANCTTDPMPVGQTVTLNCFSADSLPDDYTSITINDMF